MSEQEQTGNWQRPSVGRIVHYVSNTPGSQCRAAVVTQMTNPTDLGLAILNPSGMSFYESVLFDGADQAGGTWHWPERV